MVQPQSGFDPRHSASAPRRVMTHPKRVLSEIPGIETLVKAARSVQPPSTMKKVSKARGGALLVALGLVGLLSVRGGALLGFAAGDQGQGCSGPLEPGEFQDPSTVSVGESSQGLAGSIPIAGFPTGLLTLKPSTGFAIHSQYPSNEAQAGAQFLNNRVLATRKGVSADKGTCKYMEDEGGYYQNGGHYFGPFRTPVDLSAGPPSGRYVLCAKRKSDGNIKLHIFNGLDWSAFVPNWDVSFTHRDIERFDVSPLEGDGGLGADNSIAAALEDETLYTARFVQSTHPLKLALQIYISFDAPTDVEGVPWVFLTGGLNQTKVPQGDGANTNWRGIDFYTEVLEYEPQPLSTPPVLLHDLMRAPNDPNPYRPEQNTYSSGELYQGKNSTLNSCAQYAFTPLTSGQIKNVIVAGINMTQDTLVCGSLAATSLADAQRFADQMAQSFRVEERLEFERFYIIGIIGAAVRGTDGHFGGIQMRDQAYVNFHPIQILGQY